MWIAFRIQYLWYQQQLQQKRGNVDFGCELLSEFSIFDTNNNAKIAGKAGACVVNCFQNSVSLIPTTTPFDKMMQSSQLWIAFRIQYLWYQQQLDFLLSQPASSCELLSEFSIFDTNNNKNIVKNKMHHVVNCFQNSVSLIPTTTRRNNEQKLKQLWIAFRIQYLWYQQQPISFLHEIISCCELLSEFSIFDTNNNVSSDRTIKG